MIEATQEHFLADQQMVAGNYLHQVRCVRDNVRSLKNAVSDPITLVNLIAAAQYLDDAIIALQIASGRA